jgi:tripeptide aminopeptidase
MIRSDRLLETFLMLCRINSFHPKEEEVMQVLRSRLADAGVEVTADEIGNLLVYWPGTGGRAEDDSVMLSAHVDTILPTHELEPVVRNGAVWSDGSSVLGAAWTRRSTGRLSTTFSRSANRPRGSSADPSRTL